MQLILFFASTFKSKEIYAALAFSLASVYNQLQNLKLVRL